MRLAAGFCALALCALVIGRAPVAALDQLILAPSGGSCSTSTTTTTLPACTLYDPCSVGHDGCCTGGFCFPAFPSEAATCAFVDGTCDFNACTSDADCSGGKHCLDLSVFSAPNACCTLCGDQPPPPVCNAPIYCRCNADDFAIACGRCVGGANDGNTCSDDTDCPDGACTANTGDCPSGMLCHVLDSSTTNFHCYHLTCTGTAACSPGDQTGCEGLCANLGGVLAGFCQDGTCVGGTRDGLECDSGYSSIECPGGSCSGVRVCNCASGCPLTTSTSTTTTSTTTTTGP